MCYNTQKTQSSDGYATAATTAAVTATAATIAARTTTAATTAPTTAAAVTTTAVTAAASTSAASTTALGSSLFGLVGLHVDSGGDDNCRHWHVQGRFLIGETSVLRDLQRSQAHLVLVPYWQEHCAGGAPRAAHVSANVHGTFNETHQTSSIKTPYHASKHHPRAVGSAKSQMSKKKKLTSLSPNYPKTPTSVQSTHARVINLTHGPSSKMM